jgi:hypothetical protein
MIASLTASFLTGIAENPAVPQQVVDEANVELVAGVPFISDVEPEAALERAGGDQTATQAIVAVNEQARLDGLRSALALLAIVAVIALFFTKRIPTKQPGAVAAAASPA